MSEIQRSKIETVVHAELERYMQKARGILMQHKEFLDKLTKELIQKETLLYSDVQRIKAECIS